MIYGKMIVFCSRYQLDNQIVVEVNHFITHTPNLGFRRADGHSFVGDLESAINLKMSLNSAEHLIVTQRECIIVGVLRVGETFEI